jgi:predicted nucleic acid-binding protein
MILFDTNIISELMKPSPSSKVINWLDQQKTTKLFVSTISIAELSYGLNALPEGTRRVQLTEAFNKAIIESFKYRILSFDESAAHLYGKIMGNRKKLGKPLNTLDGQIAAIAYTQNLAIATRNVNDFTECGVDIINPFN